MMKRMSSNILGEVPLEGEIVHAISLTVEDGQITRLHAVFNPHKLVRLGAGATLSRV